MYQSTTYDKLKKSNQSNCANFKTCPCYKMNIVTIRQSAKHDFFSIKIRNMYMASLLASEPIVSHNLNSIGRIRLKHNIIIAIYNELENVHKR